MDREFRPAARRQATVLPLFALQPAWPPWLRRLSCSRRQFLKDRDDRALGQLDLEMVVAKSARIGEFRPGSRLESVLRGRISQKCRFCLAGSPRLVSDAAQRQPYR